MMVERRLEEWIDGRAGGGQAISQQPESVLRSLQGSTNTAAGVSVAQGQTKLGLKSGSTTLYCMAT